MTHHPHHSNTHKYLERNLVVILNPYTNTKIFLHLSTTMTHHYHLTTTKFTTNNSTPPTIQINLTPSRTISSNRLVR